MTASDLASKKVRHITLFDNGSDGRVNNETDSKGMLIEVNLANMTATSLVNFTNPGGEMDLLSVSQGSLELFGSDGLSPDSSNVFMGYGSLPVMSEWDVNGTALQVIHWGNATLSQSYRVYKSTSWVGFPLTSPDVAILNNSLYVSWNGATSVATWRIIQGTNTTDVPKMNFETAIPLNDTATDMLQAIALDSGGSHLASSQFIAANGTLTGSGASNGSSSTLTSTASMSTTSTSTDTSTPTSSSRSSNSASTLDKNYTLLLVSFLTLSALAVILELET